MEVLSYREIEVSPETTKYFFEKESIKNKFNKFEEKYGYFGLGSIFSQMGKILSTSSGPILEKRVLDLGCGSIQSYGYYEKLHPYEPWLCRFLHEFGVEVIGIDIANLDNEEFKHYGEFDLFKPDSLNFLPDNYIDIANASSLFDSPQVFQRIKNSALLSQHGFYTSKPLKDILISQLERVVKSEGFFIYDGEL